ncbi:MAG: DUF4345 domain-containing protein [Chitinophagaceae bacterium]|nr:MAG: DUF4345 domain-containing protein [Chitinophagaceae bacterium]
MEIALTILLVLVTLICFLGGANLLIKGAKPFMPTGVAVPPVLDDLLRFLSGIYFGLGFLMAWVLFHLREVNDLVYFIGIVVIFSGLGRLYSRIKVGTAGKYFDTMMIVEIILGLVIIILKWIS